MSQKENESYELSSPPNYFFLSASRFPYPDPKIALSRFEKVICFISVNVSEPACQIESPPRQSIEQSQSLPFLLAMWNNLLQKAALRGLWARLVARAMAVMRPGNEYQVRAAVQLERVRHRIHALLAIPERVHRSLGALGHLAPTNCPAHY